MDWEQIARFRVSNLIHIRLSLLERDTEYPRYLYVIQRMVVWCVPDRLEKGHWVRCRSRSRERCRDVRRAHGRSCVPTCVHLQGK